MFNFEFLEYLESESTTSSVCESVVAPDICSQPSSINHSVHPQLWAPNISNGAEGYLSPVEAAWTGYASMIPNALVPM